MSKLSPRTCKQAISAVVSPSELVKATLTESFDLSIINFALERADVRWFVYDQKAAFHNKKYLLLKETQAVNMAF